jgi:hypothetical protein
MTLTEQIATTIKPILDEHMRESRERIAQLERDINEARTHLEVARATCERLTKQAPAQKPQRKWCADKSDTHFLKWVHERLALRYSENEGTDYMHRLREMIEAPDAVTPQTQQDGPWCVIALDTLTHNGAMKRVYPVAYEGPTPEHWGEDGAAIVLDRRVADELRERLYREAPQDLTNMRVVSVSEWVAVYKRARGEAATK